MKLLIALCVVVSGCANGVQMTDDEAVACRNLGCAVFTQAELIQFRNKALEAGYKRGWLDSNKQAGRNL